MKPIQIMMDADLLSSLDATDEVRREGRSAVLRRAVSEYLARRRRQEIEDRYSRAYSNEPGLGPEFSDWEDQGEWPTE